MNRPELSALVFGLFMAVLEGGIWPSFSVIFAEVLAIMVSDNNQTDMRNWAVGFVGLGVAVCFILFFKFYMLTYAGEKLTARLRSKSFEAIMHHNVPWFDQPEHSKVSCSFVVAALHNQVLTFFDCPGRAYFAACNRCFRRSWLSGRSAGCLFYIDSLTGWSS